MGGQDQHVSSARRYRFGAFELDTAAEELYYRGNRVHVQEMPIRVLEMLLERPSELVRREEFFEHLWPEDELGILDDNLNVAVHKLRVALGDEAAHPNYIETVPRKGYRFVAPVFEAPGHDADSPDDSVGLPDSPLASKAAKPAGLHWAAWGGGAAALIAVAALALLLWPSPDDQATQESPIAGAYTVAVLPFANMSGDPDNMYFSDGIAEDLLIHLARVPDFRVISRSSVMRYRDTDRDLARISEELGATHFVEGSVRRADERVRISAQLIDAATGHHLWAEHYDRELDNIFAIQSEIATMVTEALQAALPGGDHDPVAIDVRPTGNVDAYRLYLEGRYLFHHRGGAANNRRLYEKLHLLEQSIELDPEFARAWALLGASNAVLAAQSVFELPVTLEEVIGRAQAAIRRAIELDPDIGYAHAALGLIETSRARWADAERHFLRALEAEAQHATARLWYGILQLSVGHSEAATDTLMRSTELDPVNGVTATWLGAALRNAGRLEDSRIHVQRSVDLGMPASGMGVFFYHVARGEWEQAVQYQEDIARMQGMDPGYVRPLVAAIRNPELIPEAVAILKALGEEQPGFEPIWFYFDLDAPDLIFDEMESFLERNMSTGAFWRMWEPQFTGLRNHSRFRELAEHAGLLDYWLERGWPDLCRPVNDGFVCD